MVGFDAVGFVLEFVDDEFAAFVQLLDLGFEGLGLFQDCGVGSDGWWVVVGGAFGGVVGCRLWRG